MNEFLIISNVALWSLLLGVGFLLLGTLRSLGLLKWRFEELEATRPVRKGREGLSPGKKAPDFTLPATASREVSLSDFAGRRVLLVFTQSRCGPCHDIAPELNRLHQTGEQQVLVVNNGEQDATGEWAAEIRARFPVVTQQDRSVSKEYQVLATPYAFVVDEQGVIAAKGVAGSPQYLRYILEAARKRGTQDSETAQRDSTVERDFSTSVSSRKVIHA
jgi:methylamine dehydrogenase accessory protein MauD